MKYIEAWHRVTPGNKIVIVIVGLWIITNGLAILGIL
jgi:hypothetical protein